ncbi:cytochrome P450 [Podospora didyma]|uniref:Cytochrome P450 n=1 Tax=Podospora didyma TaxID=330526 RepID=A0AAE0N3H8_9PEZI|nr:cytochrome P450 [Podospora didyma]
MRDLDRHKERKAKLSPAFVGQGLATMEARVDKQVSAFLDLVKRKYVSTPGVSRPMEFGHRAQYFTLDVATCVTFGEPFGFLKKDGDVEHYVELTESMIPMFGILGSLPWLVHVMHVWPVNKIMPHEGDKVGFGRLMKFAGDAVQKRLVPGDPSGEHDLIRAYLRAGLALEDVIQECITLIVAGSETTSVALRMILIALISTPHAYRKLQAEIDTYHSTHKAANTGGIISFGNAKSLPYLQATIREGMRLWPPPSGAFSKVVPKEGDTVSGYYLPPGTEIGQSMYGIGRNEAFWGPDVNVFRPERWLEASPDKLLEMQTASDLVFSSGKFICLGKPIAQMEMAKFFVELLRRYDIAIVNPPKPLKLRDPITWLTSDFWIRFTKREV